MLNNRLYTTLKYGTAVALPATATLYFTLAQIWGFPNAEAVVATITASNTFLGILMGVSSKVYNNSDAKYDGSIQVIDGADGDLSYRLLVPSADALAQIKTKDDVKLRVSVN